MTLEYIAGFVDGEGTIGYYKDRGRLSIPQTHKGVLLEIQKYLGEGKVYLVTKRQEHWKEAWVYILQDAPKVLEVLKKIEPFLIVKKEEAKNVIAILESVVEERKNATTKRTLLKEEVLKLHSKGLSTREIEKVLPVSRATANRMINE